MQQINSYIKYLLSAWFLEGAEHKLVCLDGTVLRSMEGSHYKLVPKSAYIIDL